MTSILTPNPPTNQSSSQGLKTADESLNFSSHYQQQQSSLPPLTFHTNALSPSPSFNSCSRTNVIQQIQSTRAANLQTRYQEAVSSKSEDNEYNHVMNISGRPIDDDHDRVGEDPLPQTQTINSSSSKNLHEELDVKNHMTCGKRAENLRPIIIDGSNVAMNHGNNRIFSCRGISLCVDWFLKHDHTDITVFVPRWRTEASKDDTPIQDQEILHRLEESKRLVFTPSRKLLVVSDESGGGGDSCYSSSPTNKDSNFNSSTTKKSFLSGEKFYPGACDPESGSSFTFPDDNNSSNTHSPTTSIITTDSSIISDASSLPSPPFYKVSTTTSSSHLVETTKQQTTINFPTTLKSKRIVCYDDRYILKLAQENGGIIVSNDNYRDLARESSAFAKIIETRILMYTFVNDRFMPPDDPLGRFGPVLDDFLSFTPSANLLSKDTLPVCPYGPKCTYGNKCKFYHPEKDTSGIRSIVTEQRLQLAKFEMQKYLSKEKSGGLLNGKKKTLCRTLSLEPNHSTFNGWCNEINRNYPGSTAGVASHYLHNLGGGGVKETARKGGNLIDGGHLQKQPSWSLSHENSVFYDYDQDGAPISPAPLLQTNSVNSGGQVNEPFTRITPLLSKGQISQLLLLQRQQQQLQNTQRHHRYKRGGSQKLHERNVNEIGVSGHPTAHFKNIQQQKSVVPSLKFTDRNPSNDNRYYDKQTYDHHLSSNYYPYSNDDYYSHPLIKNALFGSRRSPPSNDSNNSNLAAAQNFPPTSVSPINGFSAAQIDMYYRHLLLKHGGIPPPISFPADYFSTKRRPVEKACSFPDAVAASTEYRFYSYDECHNIQPEEDGLQYFNHKNNYYYYDHPLLLSQQQQLTASTTGNCFGHGFEGGDGGKPILTLAQSWPNYGGNGSGINSAPAPPRFPQPANEFSCPDQLSSLESIEKHFLTLNLNNKFGVNGNVNDIMNPNQTGLSLLPNDILNFLDENINNGGNRRLTITPSGATKSKIVQSSNIKINPGNQEEPNQRQHIAIQKIHPYKTPSTLKIDEDGKEVRNHAVMDQTSLYYHLASLFPAENVLNVMKSNPELKDVKRLCSILINMS